ncbi:MAG: glycine cleavage system protein GcvH [Desulfovibrionaceae bacterium]|nr:glycine cleavage system protein GcvH [Desulfovibrionaceae bacterium]
MNIPKDLKYTQTHEWVRLEGDLVVIGITDFAQEQLGDITFVELPQPGTQIKAGQNMGTVESVKAASDLVSPISGEVLEVNEALESDPGLLNREPYSGGWLIEVRCDSLPHSLLSAEAYAQLIAE